MELWIPITIAAAFSQNIRSALQKHLTGKLSTAGATQVRFFYAIPFAAIYLLVLVKGFDYPAPTPRADFFIYASIGGLSQVIATALLISLFSQRNFLVGTVYSKTETIQAALLGLIFLSDKVSAGAVAAICMGIFGVMVISSAKEAFSLRTLLNSLTTRPALIGMCSGLFFGITAICIRGASLSLSGGFAVQAAFTLLFVLILQAVVATLYLAAKEPGQIKAVLRNWRVAGLVGLAGMVASVGWFTAMTLQNAGYVRALGQIELVFAFLASVLIFKEKINRIELLGIAIIVSSIVILLIYR